MPQPRTSYNIICNTFCISPKDFFQEKYPNSDPASRLWALLHSWLVKYVSAHTDWNLVPAHREKWGSVPLPITLQSNIKTEMYWENLKRAWSWIPPKCFGVLCALTEVRRENRSIKVLLFIPIPLILCSCPFRWLRSQFTLYSSPLHCWCTFLCIQCHGCILLKTVPLLKVNMGFEA